MDYDGELGLLRLDQIDRFRLHTRQETIPVSDRDRLDEIKLICEAHVGKIAARSYSHLTVNDRTAQQQKDITSAQWAVGVQNTIDMAVLMDDSIRNYGSRR